MRRRSSISIAGLMAIGVMAAAGPKGVLAHDEPPPGGTEAHVDLKDLPDTVRKAEAQGYVVPPVCVPGMGRHATKTVEGVRRDPILLFNNNDLLVGIEFTTQVYPDDPEVLLNDYGIDLEDPSTWPVQVPPWEGPVGPHPGWPADTIHWDLHVYTVNARRVENACKAPLLPAQDKH